MDEEVNIKDPEKDVGVVSVQTDKDNIELGFGKGRSFV